MKKNGRKRPWYEYLWIVTLIYLGLGFFNILFAWLGMIFFCLPLIIALAGGGKLYCNRYCDRGRFFALLGGKLGLSRRRPTPRWLGSKWFRYGVLIFFFAMFFQMLFVTYLVGAGQQALGLSWHSVRPLGGPVCLWFLFFDAHFHPHRLHCHGAVDAPLLVRLLPHGYHDPADLPGEGRKGPAMSRGLEEQARQVAELLGRLANENRLLILCALEDGPKTVGQIGEKVPSLTRPALSQHLHLLREGELVHGEKQGQYVVYSLSDERLPQLLGTLRRLYCQGE